MTGKEIVQRAKWLSDYKYWYGAKGEVASKALADRLRRENPKVWTESYYQGALADIDGKTRVGDCSFLVCYAYDIPMIGSSQIRTKYVAKGTYEKVGIKNIKDGMILWRNGHVAIAGGGMAIQLKSQAHDYVEIPLDDDDYSYVLYDIKVKYDEYGWIETYGGWAYKNENGGYSKGWNRDVDGKWYYFHDSGIMATGWLSIGDDWYYMHTDGAMRVSWQNIEGKWYYFDSDGKMIKGYAVIDGAAYIMQENGVMQKGLIAYDGHIYYGDPGSGRLEINKEVKIGDSDYYFDVFGHFRNKTEVI